MCIEHFWLYLLNPFFLFILCCFCTGNWRQKQYATISMKLSRQVKRSILKFYITRKMVSSKSNNLLNQRFRWWKIQYEKYFSFANYDIITIHLFHIFMLRNVAMMCSKMKISTWWMTSQLMNLFCFSFSIDSENVYICLSN